MGFPPRWRNWVMGILFAGKGSILVNGSPTAEFHYNRGLRQGDPLSPFLFIIAMEALHVLMIKAEELAIFQGVKLPRNGPYLTHMFYADDAIFLGEWEETNLKNLKRILRIFYLISGLKVNSRKSHLYGVGSSVEEVRSMASHFNCKEGKFPFVYLGLKVGANMNRLAHWKEVIDLFNKKLTNWKAKTLSFAGRVILVKSVMGSLPNYYFSLYKCPSGVLKVLEGIRRKFLWGGSSPNNKIRWVKWEKVVALKDFGGLGIGNLKDMNLALLAKWWWRYRMEPENLWSRVIGSIHGKQRRTESIPFKKSLAGVWKNIGEIAKDFTRKNININTSFRSKVGRGDKTLFWVDLWMGNEPLKDQFPSLYQLSAQKKAKVQEMYTKITGGIIWDWAWVRVPYSDSEKQEMDSLKDRLQQINVDNKEDIWVWRHNGDEEFNVKAVRYSLGRYLDINTDPNAFYWNSWVTKKCSMFVWRAIVEKIPSAEALRNRGMNIQDITCKICGESEENAVHILLRCNFAKRVWREVSNWTKTPMVNVEGNLTEVLQAFLEIQRSRDVRKCLHAIAVQSMWMLWINRNDRTFAGRNRSVQMLLEEIKDSSLIGVLKRSKHKSISKEEWWDFSFRM
ncbi:putative RNA-directed DNA polymerase [Helianthus annuus]|nr:putative RNA-directed DNA polymerase [Helianthus annuus]